MNCRDSFPSPCPSLFASISLTSYNPATRTAAFDVSVAPDAPTRTTGLDVDALFARYPDLHRHRCENGRARSFYTEARDTETVHLLEHLAVELLALSGVDRAIASGKTGIPRAPRARSRARAYRLLLTGADDPETAEVVLLRAAKILSAL